MFGLIECDVLVPESLKECFEEMAPIFKNVELSRKHLSKHMLEFAQASDRLKRPQRALIGSLYGKKVLLASALAKWYLEHGLEITNVYRVYEYRPAKCYKKFGESVSDARREGDLNPDKALLAETSKLVGNSLYGKTITDKERHRKITYCLGSRSASIKLRSNRFLGLEEVEDEFYEVEEQKTRVSAILFFSFNTNIYSPIIHHFSSYSKAYNNFPLYVVVSDGCSINNWIRNSAVDQAKNIEVLL